MIECFTESERKYLMYLIIAHDNTVKGNLISLVSVYEGYGNPANKSPKDVLSTPVNLSYIEMLKLIYPNERVIEYYDHDIFVNIDLYMTYIEEVDSENHYNYAMFDKFSKINDVSLFMIELLNEESGDESYEYYDIPF